jgi:hypothetical protein
LKVVVKKIIRRIISKSQPGNFITPEKKIEYYIQNGRIPWSDGYEIYKYRFISEVLNTPEKLISFKNKSLPQDFAVGIDERSVEYPWIFSKLSEKQNTLLDAGSTFNFEFMVEHPLIKKKDLTIFTFFPEVNCFFKKRISYVFGDLRNMYFKDEFFEEIVSQSTIEHIDMDNSIYGYSEESTKEKKSYEYLKAVSEMIRILKRGGRLLMTFPFGKYEYHGFFQQFDAEMLQRIMDLFEGKGEVKTDYFKYEKTGWRFAQQAELSQIMSFNPHTGKGKSDDGAAHCRSVACIEFIKNS